jgi:hypothetical protein
MDDFLLCSHLPHSSSNVTFAWRVRSADLVDAPADLLLVLKDTARCVWPRLDSALSHAAPAVVTIRLSQRSPAQTGPFTAARRHVRDDAYCVNLAIAGPMLWSQNVFQLAHELTHVLCAVSPDAPCLLYEHKNVWFEEALCHAASLHALRSFRAKALAALYPHCPNAMRDYADDHVDADWQLVSAADEVHGRNCDSSDERLRVISAREWYRKHRRQLRDWRAAGESEQRRLQCAVSVWLLARIGWPALAECCSALNRHAALCGERQFAELSFRNYLQRWKRNCRTTQQKATVETIRQAFR